MPTWVRMWVGSRQYGGLWAGRWVKVRPDVQIPALLQSIAIPKDLSLMEAHMVKLMDYSVT